MDYKNCCVNLNSIDNMKLTELIKLIKEDVILAFDKISREELFCLKGSNYEHK